MILLRMHTLIMCAVGVKSNSKITKKSKKKTELNEENDYKRSRTSMMYAIAYKQNSKITKKSKKKTELNEENDYT